MRRFFVLFILLNMIAFGLFGCNNADSPDDEGSDTDTDSDSDSDTDTDSDSDTHSDTETDTSDYIFYEDFEGFEVGDHIVETAGEPWYTWSDPPLPDEDPVISDDQSVSPVNSLLIVKNNDVMLHLGYENGHYLVEFDIFVQEGNVGYYNFFPWLGSWQDRFYLELYLYSEGQGNLVIAGKQYPFKFTPGQWFTCSHMIDLDNDIATLTIDGEEIHTWPWSTPNGDSPHDIGCITFYGFPDPPGAWYYIDNIRIMEM